MIFGTITGSTKDLGPVLPIVCPNCSNNSPWHLYENTYWFTIYFVPLIPYDKFHRLLCPVCSKGIILDKKETKSAFKLKETLFNLQSKYTSESKIREAIRTSGLLPRAESIVPKNVNIDPGAEWNELNEKLFEAIELSNYRSKEALDKIQQILVCGVNINARNKNNKTVLGVAKYFEAPLAVLNAIVIAGGTE
ncbi:MAG: zinc ribbon domain-containing protein [Gammaproteobacteria bacterium]|nr:zinc ribbon domain-containing protein [Gammaproteobacteria bacterium]MDH5801956.1 zinc ribbon domain-containing protein [Gammaproteobacteria bacterium]